MHARRNLSVRFWQWRLSYAIALNAGTREQFVRIRNDFVSILYR